MKKYFLQTFGCQQNLSDSERIDAFLKDKFQKTALMKEADLIIFNTCSIKQHAEDRVFGLLQNAQKIQKKQGSILAVTGCMIRQTSTSNSLPSDKDNLLKKISYLNFVFRIEDTPKLLDLIKICYQNEKIINKNNYCFSKIGQNLAEFFAIIPHRKNNFSALVPIMTGCNKFCTYCIVPYSRGREQSRSFQAIKKECQQLANEKVKEILLIGQNVNAFYLNDADRKKRNSQTDFAFLLDEIAKIKGIERIRFTSPHPSQLSSDVLEVMAKHKNICQHLHLPVQSGSNKILKKMNRSHSIEEFKNITKLARQKMPNIAISTDIIVGFPGESEADFKQTKDLCQKEKFDIIYISKFSSRRGTVAFDMKDDVSLKEKKNRFAIIEAELKKSSFYQNKKWLHKKVKVLVEKFDTNKKIATGKTEQFKIVHFKTQQNLIGEIVEVKITQAEIYFLLAELIY